LSAVKAKTDLIISDAATETNATSNRTAVLSAISGLNNISTTQAQAAAAQALVNYDAATGTDITSAISALNDLDKADIAAALADQDISGVSVNENSVFRVIQKIKTTTVNPIRWNFAGVKAKLIYRNEGDSADEAWANVYKEDAVTKPLTSIQVATRDKVTFI
jgi:hypothetical protein